MSAAPVKSFPWGIYAAVLLVIVFVAALPVLSVFLTYLVADANGCTVNEATVHPCVVLGVDLGGMLYGMGVVGWLMLASIPMGAMGVCALLVIAIIHYLVHVAAETKPGVDP